MCMRFHIGKPDHLLCLCSIAVTVTALPPTRLCRIAVFLVKPTFPPFFLCRGQLGRLGGSWWGWVLQIKLRCHTNHRSLGHHHHRSPSLIREVPGERTRHHNPQVLFLWCPHVRRPKSGRHLGDLQDFCLARQNKSLTRHYERRDIVPRPTGIDSYSPAKFQFLRIHRPILCRFPVF